MRAITDKHFLQSMIDEGIEVLRENGMLSENNELIRNTPISNGERALAAASQLDSNRANREEPSVQIQEEWHSLPIRPTIVRTTAQEESAQQIWKPEEMIEWPFGDQTAKSGGQKKRYGPKVNRRVKINLEIFTDNSSLNDESLPSEPKPKLMKCGFCQATDHLLRETSDPNSKLTCPVLKDFACPYCHAKGHTKRNCPILQERLAQYST
jgi:hypothetical protein